MVTSGMRDEAKKIKLDSTTNLQAMINLPFSFESLSAHLSAYLP